jgi:predicted HTH transcriptional regulator
MGKLTAADIDRFRTMPTESEHLEFKEAKNDYDKEKLQKYCIALANEGGGFLLLGVADVLPRPVVGTTAFPKPSELGLWIVDTCGFRVDVEEIAHPDGRVLVFIIPGRPIGVPYEKEH